MFCFVSIVQNGLGLYLLRHRDGGRMCEIQGMPPNFALSGRTFRVQHCLDRQLEGRAAQIGVEEEHGTSSSPCQPVLPQILSWEPETHTRFEQPQKTLSTSPPLPLCNEHQPLRCPQGYFEGGGEGTTPYLPGTGTGSGAAALGKAMPVWVCMVSAIALPFPGIPFWAGHSYK